MCATCGCGATHAHHEDHDHHDHGSELDHDHDHAGHHHHHHELESAQPPPDARRVVDLERRLLDDNDRVAAGNRRWLDARAIVAVNLIGAPGAGKTALLEETFRRLPASVPMTVLEGDQETDNDAARLRRLGCGVAQINTGTGCHLDARMIRARLDGLGLEPGTLLAIENVGNLVCPSLFDLGERAKVVVMSVTEGEDKPLKYPHVFRASQILVVTKTDLLPYLDVDLDACLANARRVNPDLDVFSVSATTGVGMSDWCGWLWSILGRTPSPGGRA